MTIRTLRFFSLAAAVALILATLAPMLPVMFARADGGPTLAITAPSTVPGASASISGSGFSPNETVHVTFGKNSTDVQADGGGNVSGATLPVPTVSSSLQFASAWGEASGRWALAYIWVTGYAPAVSPSTWYVLPGQAITFTGTGFAPGEQIRASYSGTELGSTTSDGSGSFSMNGITLPLSLHNTQADVVFTGDVSHASVPLTLTIGQLYPSITPSAWYTAPGSVISIAGSGFAPGENVALSAGTAHASTTADSSGNFNVSSFALPATSGGSVTLTATGQVSGASATAAITLSSLSPWLTFSTYWAQGGSPLTIFGNGFAGGESVVLTSGAQTLGTTTAQNGGGFEFSGTVPFAPAGTITIKGAGQTSGAIGTGDMTVAPVYTSFTLGSYAVQRGHAIEFIGSGYLPNEPVNITTSNTGSAVVLTITADSSGRFDDSSYVIPADTAPGNMTVTATGAHSFDVKSITLYVGE